MLNKNPYHLLIKTSYRSPSKAAFHSSIKTIYQPSFTVHYQSSIQTSYQFSSNTLYQTTDYLQAIYYNPLSITYPELLRFINLNTLSDSLLQWSIVATHKAYIKTSPYHLLGVLIFSSNTPYRRLLKLLTSL